MHRRGTLLTLAVSLALASLGQAQSPAWQAARETFLKNAENLCGALGQVASAAALNRDKGTPANTLIQMARDHFAAQPDLNQDLREGTCDETSFGGCGDRLFCRS